ncbi:sugar phosphate nucleotidyltransferase, partial [Klebsiella pneumoniae]|uniref:sugar phosphate nucleotidyltransferase n=2 Tax=Pseudomonadota TaxID=1224 RepID=UPI0039C02C22
MQIGVERCPILLEPAGRNTAPALTIAALYACASDEDPILLAMPADHMVSNKPAFHAAVEQAYTEACGASVVTFGVSPSRPETGYGYIRYRDTSESGALLIESFAEK